MQILKHLIAANNSNLALNAIFDALLILLMPFPFAHESQSIRNELIGCEIYKFTKMLLRVACCMLTATAAD